MTPPPSSALAYSPDAATGAAPAPAAVRPSAARPLAVRQVRLTDFRNYRQLRLDCGGEPVVLVGANGAGKTNLLEALSFLAPGRGLRRARLIAGLAGGRRVGLIRLAARLAGGLLLRRRRRLGREQSLPAHDDDHREHDGDDEVLLIHGQARSAGWQESDATGGTGS